MHGQSQRPAAKLAGCPPRSSVFPLEPFKNKVSKPRRQGPGKRSLLGRPTKAFQGTCRDTPRVPTRPDGRQASGRDKTTTAARRLPRQATSLYLHFSASVDVSPGDRSRRAWREAVQPSGVRWQATLTRTPAWRTVAPLTVTFLHYLGEADGH